MAWDSYITGNLMAPVDAEGSTLSSAAILGLDGITWAKSDSFPEFTHEEFEKMMATFTDPTITSVSFGGTKYMKLSSDENVLRCRVSKIGFILRKTITAVVMGFYEEPTVSGQICNGIVLAMGDYLDGHGY